MSLDFLTGPITGVFLPLILKSCATWPTFLNTNVTLRGDAIDLVESLKKNSPPLTVTVVAVAAACRCVRRPASRPRPPAGVCGPTRAAPAQARRSRPQRQAKRGQR